MDVSQEVAVYFPNKRAKIGLTAQGEATVRASDFIKSEVRGMDKQCHNQQNNQQNQKSNQQNNQQQNKNNQQNKD